MNRTLIIYGCGGHGRSAAALAERAGYSSIVFIDEAAVPDERIMGHPVLKSAGDHLLGEDCLVASGDNGKRLGHSRELVGAGLNLVSIVAASAIVSPHAVVGRGCFIGERAYVGPRATLGMGTIVNTGAIVEHDCVIGVCCHVSVGATIAGSCRLGDNVTIWAGAILRDGISIASDVIVGAGAVVCESLHATGTYVGVPARLMDRTCGN